MRLVKNHILVGVLLSLSFAPLGWSATYVVTPTGSGTTCSEAAPCGSGQAVVDNKVLTANDVIEYRAATAGGTAWYYETLTLGADDQGTLGGQLTVSGRAGDTIYISGGDSVTGFGALNFTADANCRGAWLFNDNLNDASATGSNLSAVSAPGYSAASLPTGYTTGKALVVDGNDGAYRAFDDLNANFPGKGAKQSLTLSTWFYHSSAQSYDTLFAMDSSVRLAWWGGGNALVLLLSDADTSDVTATIASDYIDGVWTNIVVSFDGSTSKATVWISQATFGSVVNGTQFTFSNVTGIRQDPGGYPFQIGVAGWVNDSFFNGSIYQPAVFDRALSVGEATSIYANGITGADGSASKVWTKSSITTQPNILYLNGVVGTEKTSVDALTSSGHWYWNGTTNVLYVYAAGDPSGNVVIGQRASCVKASESNYLTFQNLHLVYANPENTGSPDYNNAGLWIGTATGIRIDGVSSRYSALQGSRIYNCDHVTIVNSDFSYNSKYYGMKVDNYSTSSLSTYSITNSNFNYNYQGGLRITPNTVADRFSGFGISGNKFNYNTGTGLYLNAVDSSTISNNEASYNGGSDHANDPENHGIYTISCAGILISGNRIINHNYDAGIFFHSDNGSGGGKWGTSHNSIIEKNLIVNAGQPSNATYGDCIGVSLWDNDTAQNLVIRHNILSGCLQSGIRLDSNTGGVPSSIAIYNNTITGNTGAAIYANYADFPVVAKNNIFSANGAPDVDFHLSTAGLTHTNNLYYRSSGNVASYNGSTYTPANVVAGFEATAKATNPLVDANTYKLGAQSPAIDVGAPLWTYAAFPGDYTGKKLYGTAPDIGAVEKKQYIFDGDEMIGKKCKSSNTACYNAP